MMEFHQIPMRLYIVVCILPHKVIVVRHHPLSATISSEHFNNYAVHTVKRSIFSHRILFRYHCTYPNSIDCAGLISESTKS